MLRMYGVDVIVFTAGIGENSVEIRAKVLEGLEFMGVYWDPKKNETYYVVKKDLLTILIYQLKLSLFQQMKKYDCP